MQTNLSTGQPAQNTEITVSRAKHFFVRALNDFDLADGATRDLLNTENALNALQAIASHYPQVDAVEAAQFACIYIGQNWLNGNAPNLKGCSPATILGAFMQLCGLGLVLRPLQPLAYLVNKGGKATIYVGVDGYQLLAKKNYPNATLRTEYVTAKELQTLKILKGSVMRVTHQLDPLRTEAHAVAMYAMLSLDGGKTIYDIAFMDSIERDKYKALHKGQVWAQWATNMWATKLAKKIYKSLALADPDGSVATADLSDNGMQVDITAVEYVSELDELLENTKVELAGCSSQKEVKELYKTFKEKASALGAEGKDYTQLFTKRGEALAPQKV